MACKTSKPESERYGETLGPERSPPLTDCAIGPLAPRILARCRGFVLRESNQMLREHYNGRELESRIALTGPPAPVFTGSADDLE